MTVFGIIVITPMMILLILYFGLAWYYADTYMNGVMINGVYAMGKTPAELNELLLAGTDAPSFTISDRSGTEYEIPLQDLGFSYSYLQELRQIQSKQNPLYWGIALFGGKSSQYTVTPQGEGDNEKLSDYLLSLDFISNQADPDHIRVEIVKEDTGYVLVDDTENLLDTERTVEAVTEAVAKGERSLDLSEAGCYVETSYTSQMSETLKLWEKVREMQDIELTCLFYDGSETLDASVISDWIALDENGEFLLDENGELTLDEAAVEAYVAELAGRHDSADGPWLFYPTRGGTVTIEKGTYGYKLNQKKQKELLMEQVYAHEDASAEPVYSQQGFGASSDAIGSTYIEVDMTNQMMYYYEGGQLQLSTPVVTGNTSKGNGTPERVCYVYYKQRNRVLIGEDYQTPVSYWMAVYGNIGIHDASWRGKFGGTIYQTNGSHGCINTPTDAVGRLYDMVEVGTPVVMFY